MANPDDIFATMTLELQPERVPVDTFRNAVVAFVKSLDVLTSEVCGDAKAIGWEISVSKGSVLFAVDPGGTSDPAAVQSIHDLAVNEPGVLRGHFQSIARTGVKGAYLWVGKERQPITRIVDKAREKPLPFNEYGTVEGELEMLSARGGPHFTIYEPIWDSGVRCTVPDDLLDRMSDMWRKRVTAHGMIHYDANGHPMSIRADDVALFPYDETPIGEFRGLLSVG